MNLGNIKRKIVPVLKAYPLKKSHRLLTNKWGDPASKALENRGWKQNTYRVRGNWYVWEKEIHGITLIMEHSYEKRSFKLSAVETCDESKMVEIGEVVSTIQLDRMAYDFPMYCFWLASLDL